MEEWPGNRVQLERAERNEQWIRRSAKDKESTAREEIRQRKRYLEWKRGREMETWQ